MTPVVAPRALEGMGWIVDHGNSAVSVKGRPGHRMPRAGRGLVVVPVTRRAILWWDNKMK